MTPPWSDPEALRQFLDELRLARYKIGLDEYSVAQDLVLAFAAGGMPLDAAEQFRDHLGPLVCSSPQEQREYKERFGSWLARSGWPVGTFPEPPGLRQRMQRLEREVQSVERGRRFWLWGPVCVLLFAVVLFLWLRLQPSSAPQVGPNPLNPDFPSAASSVPSPEDVTGRYTLFGWMATVLAVLLAASSFWWRWRANLFLARRPSQGPVEITRINVAAPGAVVFPPLLLTRIARDLRRRISNPAADLDISATVTATAREGGRLTPVYGTRQLMPEYLVLIDQVGHSDQQAQLAEELMHRLARQGVLLESYTFRSDPRVCFRISREGMPITLNELQSRYSHYRLLLVSDGYSLFNSRTGRLAEWVDQLCRWEHRALLTPELPARWGARETILARQFRLLPATVEGWTRFNRRNRSAPPERFVPVTSVYPEPLRLYPQRFLDRNSPDEESVEEMLSMLHRFLGPAGFFWLSACAVYPALDWRLTLYLGEVLQGPADEKLLSPDRLATLVRTPWLRHGFMPDWLRLRLISDLSAQEEGDIRNALAVLLTTALDGPVDGLVFEITHPHRKALTLLAGQLLRSRKTQDRLTEDRVFRTFMDSRLAVQLPRALLRLVRPGRSSQAWVNSRESGFRIYLIVGIILILIPTLPTLLALLISVFQGYSVP